MHPVKALRGFRLDTRHNFSPPVLKAEHTVPRWALPLQTPRISEPGIMTGQQVARILPGHGYAPFGRAGLPPLIPTGRDGQPKHRHRKHREPQQPLHVASNPPTPPPPPTTTPTPSHPPPTPPPPAPP